MENNGNKVHDRSLKSGVWVLLIGGITTLLLPALFAMNYDLFSVTGLIGDTIGGITSPLTSLIGSILVFLALRAQITANEIIKDQFKEQEKKENRNKEIEFINNLYAQLKDEIDDFTFHESRGFGRSSVRYELKGAIAILSYLKAMDGNSVELNADRNSGYLLKNNYSLQYLGLLKLSNKLIDRMIDSKGKGNDIEFISSRLEYMFQFKLTYNHGISIDVCENCGMRHNFLPCELYKLIYDLGLRIESLQVTVK